MGQDSIAVLYYVYPVAVCVALATGRVLAFGVGVDGKLLGKLRVLRAVYALEILLICLFLIDWILLARLMIDEGFNYWTGSGGLQAHMASSIALTLYFGCILLPDAEQKFNVDLPTCASWTVAIVFESILLARSRPLLRFPDENDTAAVLTAFTAARIFVLGFLIFVYVVLSILGRRRAATGAQHETTPLLFDQQLDRSIEKDAQTTGWLDYFWGFGILIPYIWPSKSRKNQAIALFCFLLLILQRIINILVPYQLEILTDSLTEKRVVLSEIALFVFYRGIQGQQGIIGSIRAILWIPISQALFKRLTCDTFEHVLSLSMDFHLHNRMGEVLAALSKGSALNTFFDGFVFQLFPMVFDLFVAAAYVFFKFDAIYSLVIIGVLWIYLFVTIYMAKYRGRARREMAARDRSMNATKTDAIRAYETVHHNSAISMELTKFSDSVTLFQESEYLVLFSLNMLNVIQNGIFTIGIALVVTLSAYQIANGTQSVAMFVALLSYFTQLHAPLAFFGSFFNQAQNNLVDAERMLELVSNPLKLHVTDTAHPSWCPEFVQTDDLKFKQKPSIQDSQDAIDCGSISGRVAFDQVSFSYDGVQQVLKDVSFDIAPGTHAAIVGESGSGKTTCLKLLFRFYDCDTGSVKVDGIDVRKVTIKSLRDNIGVVPQEQSLFHSSIINNLLYSKPRASHQDVIEACKAANIHERIMSFPMQYDTIVGERGMRLSGGEKQRTVLARALLKRPQILLLDEATASLDSNTESQIQEALEKATKGRTTITVAHRLSTIVRCDQILVMEKGRVMERGTHSSLLSSNGLYAAMWRKQIREEEQRVQLG